MDDSCRAGPRRNGLPPPHNHSTSPAGITPPSAVLLSGWRWAIPLLAALVVLFFSRFLFTGRFFLLRDLIFDFFAREEFYKRHLLQGVLPLWNPFTGGGEPFLSNMESGVFYPFNLLFLLLPVPIANSVLTTFHLCIAAAGVWLSCRAWRISVIGSLLAAIAFTFSTQSVTRIEFYSFLCSYCWYPMAMALFTLWLRRPCLRKFLLLAIIFGLQLLAGYPGALLFTLGTLTIHALFFVWVTRQRGQWSLSVKAATQPLLALMGMMAVALLLAMAQILPVVDILPYSLRNEINPGLHFASVNPLMLLTALFPYAYGSAGYFGKYWAPNCIEFWLGTFYVGVVPITLALTALTRWTLGERRDSPVIASDPLAAMRTPFLLTLLVIALLYAMGGYTPFFLFLWRTLPFLQWFRWPAKSLMCAAFALSCLAAVALDWLDGCHRERQTEPRAWRQRLALWGPPLLWLSLAAFIGSCLWEQGRLGEGLLRRYFNLVSIAESYSHRIPWPLLARECVKFMVVILIAAGLLQLLQGQRYRRLALVLLPCLLMADLFITTLPLLPASAMDIMHNHGPYPDLIKTQSGEGRFYRALTQQKLYGFTNEKLIRLARDTMAASWAMIDRVHSIQPMGDFKLANYMGVLAIYQWDKTPPRNRLLILRKLGCSAVLEPSLRPGYFEGDDIFPPEIIPLGPPVPSAFVVGRVQAFADNDSLLNFMTYGDQDMREVALVAQGEIDDPDLHGGNGVVPHAILRHDDTPNGLEVEVESSRPGLLVINDTYYQGWEAEVNGESTPIHQVNGTFRGVRIPAGRSRVEMAYRPRTLDLGLGISLGTLVLVLGLLLAGRLPGSTRGHPAADPGGAK